jgi:hypothetical protein
VATMLATVLRLMAVSSSRSTALRITLEEEGLQDLEAARFPSIDGGRVGRLGDLRCTILCVSWDRDPLSPGPQTYVPYDSKKQRIGDVPPGEEGLAVGEELGPQVEIGLSRDASPDKKRWR